MVQALSQEERMKLMNDFFTLRECPRCRGSLKVRTMSWFVNQTICGECSAKEDELKKKLRNKGQDPDELEGCGYMPTV